MRVSSEPSLLIPCIRITRATQPCPHNPSSEYGIPAAALLPPAPPVPQAYEGLQTAQKLRQEYLFIPAKASRVAVG